MSWERLNNTSGSIVSDENLKKGWWLKENKMNGQKVLDVIWMVEQYKSLNGDLWKHKEGIGIKRNKIMLIIQAKIKLSENQVFINKALLLLWTLYCHLKWYITPARGLFSSVSDAAFFVEYC